jgi:hypothetical protein
LPNYFANVSNYRLWLTTFGYYGEHVSYLSHKQCGFKCSKVMKLQKECIISHDHCQNCQLQVTDLKKCFNIMNDNDKITFWRLSFKLINKLFTIIPSPNVPIFYTFGCIHWISQWTPPSTRFFVINN